MPRNYVKKPGAARRYAYYSLENVEKAVEEVRSGKLSIREAADKYNVDKMKIQRTIKGKHTKKYGGQTVLTQTEENIIVDRLLLASQWGFPFTTYEIRIIIQHYLNKQGRTVKIFDDNLPGKDWAEGFLQRHRNKLTKRLAENIKRCRAAVCPHTVNLYFDNLEESLRGINQASIINYDETNLADDPGKRKVVVKRGCKHPEFVVNSSKASISVMMACAADGTLLPPFVIYRSKNIWDTWRLGGPKGARYTCTKSGWIDSNTFEEWFTKIALPYLKHQEPPRALIGDNLSSHLSDFVIGECEKFNIRFIFLPKNSTHICQPLDVSFFRPFKRHWKDLLMAWKMKGNRGCLPKDRFPSMLSALLDRMKASSPTIIKAGFEKCGIIPLNRNKVLSQIPLLENQLTNEADRHLEDSFVETLQVLRYGAEQQQHIQKKRKTPNVAPGKSVTNLDSDSENSNDDPESNKAACDANMSSEHGSDISVEMPELPPTEITNEPNKEKITYDDISEGDYLQIEMTAVGTKKTKVGVLRTFVAQVVSVSSDSKNSNRAVEVKFLKHFKESKDTFVWPHIEDKSFVYPHEVKFRLPRPKELRRGLLQFNCDM